MSRPYTYPEHVLLDVDAPVGEILRVWIPGVNIFLWAADFELRPTPKFLDKGHRVQPGSPDQVGGADVQPIQQRVQPLAGHLQVLGDFGSRDEVMNCAYSHTRLY